jgi:diacylglycerol kinase (ATP)
MPPQIPEEEETLSARTSRRRLLAVVNPVAGPVGSQRSARDLKEKAQRLGIELDLVETRPDLDGEAAVATMDKSYDVYIAIGGDGTVMEVARAAMKHNVPLAIIPRGTANAVAWHFRLPFDVGQALKVILEGKPVAIDIARAEDRDFLIMAGLGYDAAVMRDATRVLKRRFGFLAYLYSALKNLGRRPNTFLIHLDDGDPIRVRGASAIIANIGTLAGNIRLVKRVDPHDGLIDLVVLSPQRFSDFARLVFRGIRGRLEDDPRVRYFRASKIRVECRPSAPLEIDGDGIEGRHRSFEAEVIPHALTLMVPAEGQVRFLWKPDVSWSNGMAFAKGRPPRKER